MVDDSPTVLNMLKVMLAESGYSTLSATDGEEAVRIAVEEQPDLVLIDTILPRLNGYQVCRRLKSRPDTARIPVIMLTSKPHEDGQSWPAEHGIDGYLIKPFTPKQLLDAIRPYGVGKV